LKSVSTCSKTKLASAGLTFLFAIILVLSITTVPTAKAQSSGTISVFPTSGPAGTQVTISGGEFSSNPVYINFNGQEISTQYQSDTFNVLSPISYTIPASASPGSYQFSASDDVGDQASATFTVTSGSSSPTEPPTATYTLPPTLTYTPAPGYGNSPNPWLATYSPAAKNNGGGNFWTPLTMSLVAAAVVIVVLVPSFLFARRGGGKQRSLYDEERPSYTPTPSPSPYTSYSPQPPSQSRYSPSSRYQSSYSSQRSSTLAASRYSRPSSPSGYGYSRPSSSSYTSNRPSQPSNYSEPAQPMKSCPSCGKSVRIDQNICPSCNKRLK